MKTLRLLAINAAILLVLVLLGVGIAEAYLRLTVPPSSPESIFRYTLETQRYKVMKANASVLAWGKPLQTNELGFRDNQARVPAKQPGEFRIVVLGDSFTVSAGVDYERIYTSQLERLLRERHPNVKVINLAVSGYNIVQYELVLNEVALGLQPDMVLVAVFPANDFNNETLAGNIRRARGEPEPAPPAFPRSLYVWRAWLGKVETKVVGLWNAYAAGPESASAGAGRYVDPQLVDWDENIAALERIAATAKKAGLPVLVTALPHTWHFAHQRALDFRVLRFCEERDIPTVKMLDAFIEAGVRESTLRLNPLDSHPNEAYNLLVARVLAQRLDSALVRPEQARQASQVVLPR
jgi:lysophospholipase L1-like esterase